MRACSAGCATASSASPTSSPTTPGACCARRKGGDRGGGATPHPRRACRSIVLLPPSPGGRGGSALLHMQQRDFHLSHREREAAERSLGRTAAGEGWCRGDAVSGIWLSRSNPSADKASFVGGRPARLEWTSNAGVSHVH